MKSTPKEKAPPTPQELADQFVQSHHTTGNPEAITALAALIEVERRRLPTLEQLDGILATYHGTEVKLPYVADLAAIRKVAYEKGKAEAAKGQKAQKSKGRKAKA